jgi:RimJ/RimL family protein N-acetyltransferase
MIGARLVVRDYRLADAEAACTAIQESRASLARWVPDIARHQTPAEVRAALQRLATLRLQARGLVFGLWERTSGDFLGEVGLYRVDWARRSGEVGYWLRQSARGHGYAAEGLALLCDQARSGLGLRRLEAHIAADNLASRRVAERQGFQCVGQRPAVPRWDGAVDRMLIYARLLEPALAA